MATFRERLNGHIGHLITIVVLLLTMGASYGVLQNRVLNLENQDDRIERRLERIEDKQDQLLQLLKK